MNKYARLILLVVFIVFCYFFTGFYIGKECNLYPCDYVEQNLFYYDFGSYIVNHDFGQFFREMWYDVNHWNRHPFLVIFLLPFYFIFKNSRFGFILASEIVFMLPVMVLASYILKNKIVKQDNFLTELFLYSSVFLCPSLWLCSLKGIPDICGMIPILFAWILYFKDDMSSFKSYKTVIAVSLLLYLSFLMRRWYSVIILCFFVSVVLENIINYAVLRINIKELFGKIGCTIINLLYSGIIIAGLGFLIQTEYVKRIYQSESAERPLYSFGITLIDQLKEIFVYNAGLLYTFFAVAAVVLLIKNKQVRFVLMNLLFYLFSFYVIMNHQFLWINHNLFLAVCIIILFCTGVCKLLSYIKSEKAKNVILSVFILLNITNFAFCFICWGGVQSNNQNILLSSIDGCYVQNENYQTIKSLYSYLENEYKKNDKIKVALYTSNDNIGYYQLRELSGNSDLSKNNILCEFIADSDYNFAELLADFAIMIDDDNIFLDKSLCRVLYTTRDLFLKNEGIAKNYSLAETYKLSDGKIIFLYKREKPLSVKQMREYAQKFYPFYPEWEEKFENFLKDNNLS